MDIDVGQGNLSIPGTIGAMAIERPADVEEGFSQLCPLIYHFGHKTPSKNPTLHNLLVTKLAKSVAEKMEANRISKAWLCCHWNGFPRRGTTWLGHQSRLVISRTGFTWFCRLLPFKKILCKSTFSSTTSFLFTFVWRVDLRAFFYRTRT